MAVTPNTDLDPGTEAVEHHDAQASPDAGPEPTPDEEAVAERAAPADPSAAESYKKQVEAGARLEGEGAVDVANDGLDPEVP